MAVKFIHFWTGRSEAAPRERARPEGRRRSVFRVARCGVRIGPDDFGRLTTAHGPVSCQRCRNFLESDRKKALEDVSRGRR